jgi:predicted RNase H-like HicB family nuclease
VKYHFKYAKEGASYWAKCVELDGCFTQGKTLDDLKENMHEALNLHLDEPANSKTAFAPPKKSVKGRNIVAVSVDPKIAFALNLRRFRARNILTGAVRTKESTVKHRLKSSS